VRRAGGAAARGAATRCGHEEMRGAAMPRARAIDGTRRRPPPIHASPSRSATRRASRRTAGSRRRRPSATAAPARLRVEREQRAEHVCATAVCAGRARRTTRASRRVVEPLADGRPSIGTLEATSPTPSRRDRPARPVRHRDSPRPHAPHAARIADDDHVVSVLSGSPQRLEPPAARRRRRRPGEPARHPDSRAVRPWQRAEIPDADHDCMEVHANNAGVRRERAPCSARTAEQAESGVPRAAARCMGRCQA